MPVTELALNYSTVGDTISFITCFAVFILIRNSLYFEHDRAFDYIQIAMGLIMTACASNVGFSYACSYEMDPWIVIALRNIYHTCLLISLFLILVYLKHLLSVDGLIMRSVSWITRIVFIVGIVADDLSQLTRYGLYYDGTAWADPTMKPFTIVYIYSMVLMAFMMLAFRHRLINPVSYSLITVMALASFILIVSSICNTNTYTTFTYVLPIVVVIILIHSKPYDLNTGAMGPTAFDSYAMHLKKQGKTMDILALKLELTELEEVPMELGKTLYFFWKGYLSHAVLFSLQKGIFILAVEGKGISGNTENIRFLLYDKFPKYYDIYRLSYRVFTLENVDYINDSRGMLEIVDQVCDTMAPNTMAMMDEKLAGSIRDNRTILRELEDIDTKKDLEDPRVLVYCQPVKNVRNDSYDTAEALMRLDLPELGIVSPEIFIPLAERHGRIHILSMIILDRVCAYIKKTLDAGYNIKRVSVNFAISELSDKDFCQDVISTIDRHGIPFEKIGVELTESQNDEDYNLVKEKINVLKSRGIKIYLDDFGTGYSNFDRILRLGMDVIKFDRSLLLMAGEDQKAAYSMGMFSEAFSEMGYGILFEGVETETQENICRTCNADYLQGFNYSRPIPIEQLTGFLKKKES